MFECPPRAIGEVRHERGFAMTSAFLRVSISTLLAASASGCGSGAYELAPVRGRVTTCEGKPAVGGVVTFQPIDDPAATNRKQGNPGRPARGTVEADGTFTLKTIGIDEKPGAVTGRHQ